MGRIRPSNIGTPDRMPPRPPFPPRTPDRTPPRPPVTPDRPRPDYTKPPVTPDRPRPDYTMPPRPPVGDSPRPPIPPRPPVGDSPRPPIPPRPPVGDRPRPPRGDRKTKGGMVHADSFTKPPVPTSTVGGGGRDFTRPMPADAVRQVTLIDKETGVKYGGAMKYNPDTGKFDRMFKTPTREEFQRIKQQRDEMTNRRRNETSDFGSRIGRDGPATMDFRDSDGDGTDDRYQRGPGAPDSRSPVGRRRGRRRPPSSFSPIKGGDRPRPENPSTFNPRDRGRRRDEAMMIERRERRDEQRARRREEMMRRRERGGFGGGFGREGRGPRRRRGPAISTVDNATSRERPTSIDRRPSSEGGGGFLNRFVSTLRR